MNDVCMMPPTSGGANENAGMRNESVANILAKVHGITGDITAMVNSMSDWLVGDENAEIIENEIPNCFKDDMGLHYKQLSMIANKLARLMEGMGVSR